MEIVELICTCPLESECRCNECRCDPSVLRDLDELLPDAEALEAAGICPWCGFPEP